jgi:hypothetical protein
MHVQKPPAKPSRDRTARRPARRGGPAEGALRGGSAAGAHALRSATGITDEEALSTLGELGFTPETVCLLHLVPLVHVAWSERGMGRRERKLIQDLAQLRGVRYGSPAFEVLAEWLERPLPQGHFEKSLRVIRTSLDAMPDRMRAESVRTVVAHCTKVAAATRESAAGRDSISAGEHDVLEHIVGILEG